MIKRRRVMLVTVLCLLALYWTLSSIAAFGSFYYLQSDDITPFAYGLLVHGAVAMVLGGTLLLCAAIASRKDRLPRCCPVIPAFALIVAAWDVIHSFRISPSVYDAVEFACIGGMIGLVYVTWPANPGDADVTT